MKKLLFIPLVLILIIGSYVGFRVYNYYHYSGELIGIKGTNLYHRDNCQFVKKSDISKLIFFKNLKNTVDKQYGACKTCNPPNNKKEIQKEIKNLEDALAKIKINPTLKPSPGRYSLDDTYLTPRQKRILGNDTSEEWLNDTYDNLAEYKNNKEYYDTKKKIEQLKELLNQGD